MLDDSEGDQGKVEALCRRDAVIILIDMHCRCHLIAVLCRSKLWGNKAAHTACQPISRCDAAQVALVTSACTGLASGLVSDTDDSCRN